SSKAVISEPSALWKAKSPAITASTSAVTSRLDWLTEPDAFSTLSTIAGIVKRVVRPFAVRNTKLPFSSTRLPAVGVAGVSSVLAYVMVYPSTAASDSALIAADRISATVTTTLASVAYGKWKIVEPFEPEASRYSILS